MAATAVQHLGEQRPVASPAARFLYLWSQIVTRDLKARYKQTVLGGLWGLGRPLLELGVYAIVFGTVLGAPSDGLPYPLFAYAGVVVWTFVARGLLGATHSVSGHAGLVSSVPFPKATLPLAAISAALVDAAVAALPLGVALAYYRVPLTAHVLWLVPIGCILVLLVTGIGLIASALNVFYRDVGHLAELVMRVWLLLTPVVYATSAVPERYRSLYALNPLVSVFENVRGVLIEGAVVDWPSLAYPAAVSVGVLLVAIPLFRRMQPYFAESV